MKITKEDILETISSMSLIEIIELINDIEKKFGITQSNYQNLNISQNIKEKKEKEEFDLYLKSIGNNKIAIIKIIRSYLNLGLKESKDLVESCPVLIKKDINQQDLQNIKKSLEENGAQIEVK